MKRQLLIILRGFKLLRNALASLTPFGQPRSKYYVRRNIRSDANGLNSDIEAINEDIRIVMGDLDKILKSRVDKLQ